MCNKLKPWFPPLFVTLVTLNTFYKLYAYIEAGTPSKKHALSTRQPPNRMTIV